MKHLTRFLVFALFLVPGVDVHATVATTSGSNLTAYNPNMGAINNNNWNNALNPRTPGGATGNASANFGNCNSVILRCAQPKCATGGCVSMDVATPIVAGCVQSNDACKQYGDDLIQSIAAQLVASSTAKANQAAMNAQASAAQAAAAQSQQQLQQMQAQMQQMQSQMAQQNAAATQQLQAAIEEQKKITAQAVADATAAQAAANNSGLSNAQLDAASNGISADVLARQQISGQIMDKVDGAMVAMKSLKATMENAFAYAGCDRNGDNCTGPKRVKMFKDKAADFFDPYENVLDEIYDALVMAQSLGVDITDIYMMLNGTCNAWAQYLCADGQVMHYTNLNCVNGQSEPVGGVTKAGVSCTVGQVVPMSNGGCQLIKMLANDAEVQQNWLYPESGDNGAQVRVGCASEALENSVLFRNRSKQASIDIDVLRRIIEQDAPNIGVSAFGNNTRSVIPDAVKYCAVNADTYETLQQAALMKKLPEKVCVSGNALTRDFVSSAPVATQDYGAQLAAVFECEDWAKGRYVNGRCMCGDQVMDPDKSYCDVNGFNYTIK